VDLGSKQGSWILGGGWNNDLWEGDLPTASWIDDISPNNPVSPLHIFFPFWKSSFTEKLILFKVYEQVWLSRVDGHMGLANSVALKLAGITNITDDPMGGIIVRAANGGNTLFSLYEKEF